ncbi:MAG: OmpH family outer membrane protein [Deltaproteobacteria bacterium]|nr:OmpH family outer membrane protein [Deltaproteobacteria bacterium]MCL5278190.1 OmpH family outer membrane protein [Deltaproteobacteria bacterium]
MKKTISMMAALTFILIPWLKAYGAGSAAKIGYIDLQKILLQSNEGKKAEAEFKKQVELREKQLKGKKQELEGMQKSIEAQSSLLSRDALMEKQAEFVKKRDAFLKLAQEYDKELQEKNGELTKKILLRVQGIITTIGKQGHYSVILEKSQGGILYAPSSEDLTDEVLDMFNKQTAKTKGTDQ